MGKSSSKKSKSSHSGSGSKGDAKGDDKQNSKKKQWDIYITVYRGDPVDTPLYRHVGLWCKPIDGYESYFFHIVGSMTAYSFEEREDWAADRTASYLTTIHVGRTKKISVVDLRLLMSGVHIANDIDEFNCQTWVKFALAAMVNGGYLTSEQIIEGQKQVDEAITAVFN